MPKALHPMQVLVRPLITEKGTLLASEGKYAFEVAEHATKPQIKEAVQKAFNVTVVSVNTMHVPGKMRRVFRSRGMTRAWKKAIVTVSPGDKIELFEGV